MIYYYRQKQVLKLNFKRKKSKKPLLLLILLLALSSAYLIHDSELLNRTIAFKERLLPPEPAQQKQETPEPSTQIDFKPLPAETKNRDAWHQAPVEKTKEETKTVSSGDTLDKILQKNYVSRSEAHSLIQKLRENDFNPRSLRQGQELTLAFTEKQDKKVFQGLKIKLDVANKICVIRESGKQFSVQKITRQLDTRPALAEAQINSSLYQAAVEADLPIKVLMQIIKAYSYDVDFQREIRSGDKIEVMYEEKIDQEDQVLEAGSALYATLHTRDREIPIYRYKTSDKETDFFDPQGESVRKTLMVTPIDGARISSGYGQRQHPISGYTQMHRGLDFAAPTGTPIMAAGDGVVEYAGRKGGYGHYIRIRHPNEYKTVYAHLSRYAQGIRQGARVEQGQTLGYVGSTGRSTGPHLHYEVHHRGDHVNPATVETPPGRTLEGEELQRFKLTKQKLEEKYASLREDLHLARKEKEQGTVRQISQQ